MYNQTHRDTHTQRSADVCVCVRERAERVTDYIQSSSELIARKSYQSKSLIKAIYAHTQRGETQQARLAQPAEVAVEHTREVTGKSIAVRSLNGRFILELCDR